ncbi:MAG: OadG family protein [Bacilli bacterium]|nr:OadG family protein [Bacilli bacterium]
MVILGIFNVDDFSFLDGLLVAFMAIVMVFAILLLVIAITSGFSKTISVVDAKNNILARPENKILDEDEDAVVATLVATIDFHKETGKDANVVSVTRIDE